ncbi:MAG: hypothetical protein FJ387_06670 [Verrucomicrobia bacterium]|nr:hypothetical protein [Verrucomicrobiota bacterium]
MKTTRHSSVSAFSLGVAALLALVLRDARGQSLGDALDAPGLAWTTSGPVGWFGQSAISHDGADAAQSGSVAVGEESILQTTLTGPGILSFWWKSGGALELFVEDEAQFDAFGALTPQVNWVQRFAFIPAGPQADRWKAYAGGDWVDQVVLTPSASTLALDVALDTPGRAWTNQGTRGWFGQTHVTHDGLGAAQCVPTADNAQAVLQTTVTGPAVLTFWWKVSSLGTNEFITRSGDFLEFHANGEAKERICNEVDWEQKSYTLPEGDVVIQWLYTKNIFFTAGSDAAWVDQVQLITGGSTPPAIVKQPQSQAVPDSSPATFDVQASGSPPLFYQWHFQGAVLTGATNATLTLTNVTGAQAGSYFVVVSNAAGAATSSIATLTVKPPLAEALDTPAWAWTTTGGARWFGQTEVTHDGVDAAQSGALGPREESVLQTTVTGPGVLRFWWRVTLEGGSWGMLSYLGDEPRLGITEDSVWESEAVVIPPGLQTVRWVCNSGVGWVDQVTFTPSGPAADLATALDTPGWTWETSSQAPWFGQTLTTQDGVDAAQSAPIPDGQRTWIKTALTGPGYLSFWWKTSSELGHDWLGLLVGDTKERQISGESAWEPCYVAIPSGPQVVQWLYQKDVGGGAVQDAGWVDQVRFLPSSAAVPLDVALETPGWTWTNAGFVGWFGQTNVTHDGVDAAQSGPITHVEYGQFITVMETTVTGPGVLSFWWKVSCERDYDVLGLLVNMELRALATGEQDWEQRAFTLPEGPVSLIWAYRKDESGLAGLDAAWVDEIRWITNASLAPAILRQSGDQTVGLGGPGGFEVEVLGSWPLFYQWHFNGTALAGATNAELTWSSVTPSQHGAYFVVVSNAAGTVVSTTATLVVSVPLAEALNTPGRLWSTGGQAPWFGQTATTHDGESAARTGPITHNEQSELETTVIGPGYLSFWWKVSCENLWDGLEFFVNGTSQMSLSGEVEWTNVVLALPVGTHALQWVYSKNYFPTSAGQDAGWLDQVAFVPTASAVALDQALDTPGWTWTTAGGAGWLGETSLTHDGSDAAQAGVIPDFQHSSLKTTVSGPRILTFWWKVSSERDYDLLQFLINGEVAAQISGEVDWHQHAFSLPPGPVTLEWVYAKDGCDLAGADAGWVDRVRLITDATTAPTFLQQPVGTTVEAGTTVTFAMEALGSWPISYQWQRNDAPLPGATMRR